MYLEGGLRRLLPLDLLRRARFLLRLRLLALSIGHLSFALRHFAADGAHRTSQLRESLARELYLGLERRRIARQSHENLEELYGSDQRFRRLLALKEGSIFAQQNRLIIVDRRLFRRC